jgi:hypothetical protein
MTGWQIAWCTACCTAEFRLCQPGLDIVMRLGFTLDRSSNKKRAGPAQVMENLTGPARLAQRLHPSPALGGVPTCKARLFIDRTEAPARPLETTPTCGDSVKPAQACGASEKGDCRINHFGHFAGLTASAPPTEPLGSAWLYSRHVLRMKQAR